MSNHFSYVPSDVLEQLKHLKIPNPIDISQSTFIASGRATDMFKAEHHSLGPLTKGVIAIKQLRLYLKKDITMVCIKQVHKPLFRCLFACNSFNFCEYINIIPWILLIISIS